MKIISHRGKYSKKSHENSIKTILRADKLLPKYIEIDIQQNYQGDLILSHDLVADMNHQEQKQLPRLIDLLNNTLKSTLLIEIKQPGISKKILDLINKKGDISFTTFSLEDALYIRDNANYEVFIMQRVHPFGLMKKCLHNKLDGVGVNKNWLVLLPFIYRKCQSNNKKMFLYTVNSKPLARFLTVIMPNIYICTDNTKEFSESLR